MRVTSLRDESQLDMPELYGLRTSLRNQIVLPLELLIKEILELTRCYDEDLIGITQGDLKRVGVSAQLLRDKCMDYWMLLDDKNELSEEMNDRIKPVDLLSRIFVGYRNRLKIYVSPNEDLGVLYGNEDWLADALAAVLENMKQVHGLERVLCELQQNNDELFISFQGVGLVIPSAMQEIEDISPELGIVHSGIDMALARRILHLHGGAVRCSGSSDTVRFVISLPTGAPSNSKFGVIHEEIEAELAQLLSLGESHV